MSFANPGSRHGRSAGSQGLVIVAKKQFDANGTWFRDPRAVRVRVVVIGGGNGGRGGNQGYFALELLSYIVGAGQSAGSGGPIIEQWFDAEALGWNETVTVGSGGVGGAINGGIGGTGGRSSFGLWLQTADPEWNNSLPPWGTDASWLQAHSLGPTVTAITRLNQGTAEEIPGFGNQSGSIAGGAGIVGLTAAGGGRGGWSTPANLGGRRTYHGARALAGQPGAPGHSPSAIGGGGGGGGAAAQPGGPGGIPGGGGGGGGGTAVEGQTAQIGGPGARGEVYVEQWGVKS